MKSIKVTRGEYHNEGKNAAAIAEMFGVSPERFDVFCRRGHFIKPFGMLPDTDIPGWRTLDVLKWAANQAGVTLGTAIKKYEAGKLRQLITL
nr:MAG: Pyocin activator protein PrtN [Bacteriophage sp.]